MKTWRVRKYFGDVVYDLRSRNLLLVVAMLLVGIVAVPILVSSSGSGSANAPSSLALGSAVSTRDSGPAESAVVAYHPGIRNFKKRLSDLSAKDPFVQHFATGAGGSALDQATSASAATSLGGGSTVSGGSGNSGTGGGGGNGGGSDSGKTQTLYTYYVTNVRVGEAGGTLASVNAVNQFQFLPSQDKPVLVYLGTASAGSQALFLVSKDVTSVGGDGTCFPTADDCQLLGLKPGSGADLIYGPDGKTYHVDVTKIKRVTSSKPPA